MFVCVYLVFVHLNDTHIMYIVSVYKWLDGNPIDIGILNIGFGLVNVFRSFSSKSEFKEKKIDGDNGITYFLKIFAIQIPPSSSLTFTVFMEICFKRKMSSIRFISFHVFASIWACLLSIHTVYSNGVF